MLWEWHGGYIGKLIWMQSGLKHSSITWSRTVPPALIKYPVLWEEPTSYLQQIANANNLESSSPQDAVCQRCAGTDITLLYLRHMSDCDRWRHPDINPLLEESVFGFCVNQHHKSLRFGDVGVYGNDWKQACWLFRICAKHLAASLG